MQKFYVNLIVCKTMSIETLVDKIRNKIRKDSVVAESMFCPACLYGFAK